MSHSILGGSCEFLAVDEHQSPVAPGAQHCSGDLSFAVLNFAWGHSLSVYGSFSSCVAHRPAASCWYTCAALQLAVVSAKVALEEDLSDSHLSTVSLGTRAFIFQRARHLPFNPCAAYGLAASLSCLRGVVNRSEMCLKFCWDLRLGLFFFAMYRPPTLTAPSACVHAHARIHVRVSCFACTYPRITIRKPGHASSMPPRVTSPTQRGVV